MSAADRAQAPELWDRKDVHHDKIGAHTLGFWLYILSDSMMYATLFSACLVLGHRMNAAGGPMGASVLHPLTAYWETLLILASVLALGLAMGALKRGRKGALLAWMAVAFVLGAGFAALSVHATLDLIAKGITPERSGYLSADFALILYHAIHIGLGLIWFPVMMVQVAMFGFHPNVVYRLLNLKLFWFFQGFMWVLVFSFTYLRGILV